MFCHDPELRSRVQAWNLDRARAWAGNFIVPEQQAGPGGQPPYMLDTPEPGEMRKMAYSSIARGADSLLFFRWRTCRFGAEEFWCGLLDHDNVPRRRYAEAAQLGQELKAIGPKLLGTSVFVDAAIATSDLDVSAMHANYGLGLPHPDEAGFEMHRALYDLGYAVGAIHPSDNLTGVKLYVMPHGTIVDPAWLPNLRTFVEQGGVLVLGARCGTHDKNGNVVGQSLPGVLADLAGVTVEEYGRQNRPDLRPLALDFGGVGEQLVATSQWYEELKLNAATAETLVAWRGRHLTGKPAITVNRVGAGCVVYVGTWLTHEVVHTLLAKVVLMAGLRKPWHSAPLGVEVVRREQDGHRLWFFINHANRERVLPSTPIGSELITGRHTDGGEWQLPLHGIAVIAEKLHNARHDGAVEK